MSYGYQPFGYVGFGAPGGYATARVLPTTPDAAYFDPEAREYPFDELGNVRSLHPVDQEVAHRLGMLFGAIASDPSVGLVRDRIRSARSDVLDAIFADAVNVALAAPIARGDVTVLSTQRAPNAGTRALFLVDYVNNRLPSSTTDVDRTRRLTLGS